MLTDIPHDELDYNAPHGATSASPESFTERLVATGARLHCPSHRLRSSTMSANLSTRVRQQVLRAYPAENLTKARIATEELVRAGFNTGDVSYGFRATGVRICRPRWRTRLPIEP